jgi:hypothetical protein
MSQFSLKCPYRAIPRGCAAENLSALRKRNPFLSRAERKREREFHFAATAQSRDARVSLSLSLSRWSSEIKNSILSMVHAREIVYRVTRDLAGKSRYGYVNVAVR